MKDYFLENEYEISPAGGETGQAFVAIHDDEKIFLKRNSSPFLAALSVENIVPKLVWTRRITSGDVITAQKWVNCRVLTDSDMTHDRVRLMLQKIHTSKPLREMLQKIEKRVFSAAKLLERLDIAHFQSDALFVEGYNYLKEHISEMDEANYVVCHGDIHHNNWIISDEDNNMYLVDWDEAMLADRCTDIGIFLYQYLPRELWKDWLRRYGMDYNLTQLKKLKWYALSQALYQKQTKASKQVKMRRVLMKILNDEV